MENHVFSALCCVTTWSLVKASVLECKKLSCLLSFRMQVGGSHSHLCFCCALCGGGCLCWGMASGPRHTRSLTTVWMSRDWEFCLRRTFLTAPNSTPTTARAGCGSPVRAPRGRSPAPPRSSSSSGLTTCGSRDISHNISILNTRWEKEICWKVEKYLKSHFNDITKGLFQILDNEW